LLSAILTTVRTATVDACATEPEHTPNVYALAEMAHRLLNAKLKCMLGSKDDTLLLWQSTAHYHLEFKYFDVTMMRVEV
jgi:hypothetical protein